MLRHRFATGHPDLTVWTEKCLRTSVVRLHCSVTLKNAPSLGSYDVDSIYECPEMLHNQGIDSIITEQLQLNVKQADLTEWKKIVHAIQNPKHTVKIAMVGKYVDLTESYKSLIEALKHAGIHTETDVQITFVDSESIEKSNGDVSMLKDMDAILVPGGFGSRGVEGKIAAVRYARENNVPYLGICLGMQIALIEYARDVAGLKGANSTEFDLKCAAPVVALIDEWQTADGSVETRDESADLGRYHAFWARKKLTSNRAALPQKSTAANISANVIATATRSTTTMFLSWKKPVWSLAAYLQAASVWLKPSNCQIILGSSRVSSIRNLLPIRAKAILCSARL